MPSASTVCDRCGSLVASTHWGVHLDYHRRLETPKPRRAGRGGD